MTSSSSLPRDYKVYLLLAAIALAIAVVFPRAPKFGYDYSLGTVWQYETLVAQFDFPIYKTEEQIQEEKARTSSEIVPYYRYSREVGERKVAEAEALGMDGHQSLRAALISALKSTYDTGVLPDEVLGRTRDNDNPDALIYVQRDKRASKYPLSEIPRLSEASHRLRSIVFAAAQAEDSAFLQSFDFNSLIVPNLMYDSQTTDLVHSGTTREVSPTQGYVTAGTLIVSEGELVTTEIAQMLDSYRKEFESNMGSDSPEALTLLGNLLVSLLLVSIFFFTIYFISPVIFTQWKEFLYLSFIFLLAALPVLVISRHSGRDYLLLAVPFTLTALYLQAFFRNRLIISILIVSLLPLLVVSRNGAALYMMFLLAGLVSIYMFKNFNKGAAQFVVALVAFMTLALSYTAFRLFSIFPGSFLRDVLMLAIGCVLSVALYPMVYLFEKIFGLLSSSTLVQISDTGSKLLRELENKAPGTFQHSLQVMSMADTVARAIGADEYLIRAGALYHDIGKMNNPRCFVENESILMPETGYHDELSPLESSQDIIKHVTDGVEIAREYHLPAQVIDFIRTHHGTTCTSFFYQKFLSQGGSASGMEQFCYPGPRPTSKEQVILMLCDSIEAASRTLKEHSPKAFNDFVESMVDAKSRAGQLDDSEITARELGIAKEVIKNYLAQLYHGRIAYPKKNNLSYKYK